MKESKTKISKASSYLEIGDFWNNNDLADHWDKTKSVDFDVDIQVETTYLAIEKKLSKELHKHAHEKGVSPETLVNLWIQEKLKEQKVK